MPFSEHELIGIYTFSKLPFVILDVGAHQGNVSLNFLSKGWKVIAFEPEKNNREKLLKKVKGKSNFTCIPKAVSDVTGEIVPFYTSQEHYGIHSLKPWHETHLEFYKVETIRLDDALAELGVMNVNMLKIDIEGADFLALKGFDFDRIKPELVMVEFMDERTVPNFDYSYHDMVEYMKKKGYRTFVSEWAPIKEYGREGVKGEAHQWLQCAAYPLDHEPSWGNLFFVPNQDVDKFVSTLDKYLKRLQFQAFLSPLKNGVRKIPGALDFYRWLKKWKRNSCET